MSMGRFVFAAALSMALLGTSTVEATDATTCSWRSSRWAPEVSTSVAMS